MRADAGLTYFDIRGRAECIRLLLEEVGLAYEDRRITNAEWQDLKPRTPFGQLPLLRLGDVELSQTMAILRHLARAHGLSGNTEAERTRCDIAIEAIRDADQHLGRLVWTPGFEQNAGRSSSTSCLGGWLPWSASLPRMAPRRSSGQEPRSPSPISSPSTISRMPKRCSQEPLVQPGACLSFGTKWRAARRSRPISNPAVDRRRSCTVLGTTTGGISTTPGR